MNHFLDTAQIEEMNGFDFYDQDEELTKQMIEDYYDDLAFGLPLDSNNDF
jgi:hypothetical protein